MIGRELGSYRIVSRLGAGAMGIVYLGEKEGGDERVAVKVLHPHLLEKPGYFKRFQREILAGCRVAHPNVVRTLDGDLAKIDGEAVCYLVMEYVEGRTLRALLKDLGRIPEWLVRDIATQLAAGLAAIHEQEIVHRDLKPENIVITADETVKIMDLGLVRLDTGVRISTTNQFVGSLLYAAPEQLSGDGESPDARTDLFALGVILHELITGSHPFVGDLPAQVIDDILTREAAPVREIFPGVSSFLETVIRRLLAKSRDDRFSSAGELLAVLRSAEGSQWWGQKPATAVAPAIQHPGVPRQTPVCGRDRELARLESLYDRVREGEGRVVLVEGAAGVGKTRLVDEFLERLETRGEVLGFLFGSYPPGGAATPLQAFARAFHERFDAADLEAEIARRLSSAPGLAARFPAVLRGEPPGPGEEPLSRDSIHTAFTQLMRSLSAERPTVLFLDDLHFAPQDGLSLFFALALAVPDHRLMLVGTTRRPLGGSWHGELERLEHVSRISLPSLDPDAIRRIVEDALAAGSDVHELAALVSRKSDGNPLFAFEILRELQESQLLRKQPGGGWKPTTRIEEVTIPSTIAHLIEARLADLEEGDRNLLELAACCGFEFDPLIVADAQEQSRIPMLRRLSRIERTTGLVCSVGSRFAFDHHLIQETLYEGLPEALRGAYHALIAETMEAAVGGDPAGVAGATAVEICDHHGRGGSLARALPYLERALDHLVHVYHHERAVGLARTVLEAPGLLTGLDRVDLLVRLGERLDFTAQHDAAREALTEALELADRLRDASRQAVVRHRLGQLLGKLGESESARDHLARAGDLAREAGDAVTETAVQNQLGNVHADLGDLEEAGRCYERSLAIASASGNRRAQAAATANLGQIALERGRAEEARGLIETSLEEFRSVGDRLAESQALNMLGLILDDAGRYAEAADHHRRQRAIAREIGYRRGEAIAESNLGESLRVLGRLGEARRHLERSAEISAEIGDRPGVVSSKVNLGMLHGHLGRNRDAMAAFERAVSLSRDLGARRDEGLARLGLARIHRREGRLDRALELATEAEQVFREYEYAFGLGEAHLVLGRIHHAGGEIAAARSRFEQLLGLGSEAGMPRLVALGRCGLALVGAGEIAEARDALETHANEIGPRDMLEGRYMIWRATGEVDDLGRCRATLDGIEEPLSGEDRRTMAEGIPMVREIRGARAG